MRNLTSCGIKGPHGRRVIWLIVGVVVICVAQGILSFQDARKEGYWSASTITLSIVNVVWISGLYVLLAKKVTPRE
jgi:hypothetical protein